MLHCLISEDFALRLLCDRAGLQLVTSKMMVLAVSEHGHANSYRALFKKDISLPLRALPLLPTQLQTAYLLVPTH